MDDHRKIARQLDLFHFEDHSPGMVFWHPTGWQIFHRIEEQMRTTYTEAGYAEVRTPQFLSRHLWEQSGHWEKFAQQMFVGGSYTDTPGEDSPVPMEYALKPMSCPAHIAIYQTGVHSYRSLPYRLFEFGVVHRNELSGVISGCMRLRQFTQDDAHVFCRADQLQQEVSRYLAMIGAVYARYNFSHFHLKLSTRPQVSMGEAWQWHQAEEALADACTAQGIQPQLNPGEGAFYGPKLEVVLQDALGRDWQCGTVQLDFNLPRRFALTYRSQHGSVEQPFIVHQAVLGSLERWVGILLENSAGALPLWLTPIQAMVLTVSEKARGWAQQVTDELKARDIRTHLDTSAQTLAYKIRLSSKRKIPFVFIVGEKEASHKTVALRQLGSRQQQSLPLAEILRKLQDLLRSDR